MNETETVYHIYRILHQDYLYHIYNLIDLNLITRLFFDSFYLLIVLIQKIQKINRYQMHGFVSGSDTTEGEGRSKTQRNLKFIL